ncbi:MAG: PAS domain-containing protein, partial [Verrucomicrobiales bacterium]
MSSSTDHHLKLMDILPALIWGSGMDARCNYFNRSWLDFTGRRLEEELGDGWTKGIHPGDFDDCLSTYLDHFRARKPFEMEYRLRRADGSYRWIAGEARPVFAGGETFEGYIGYCHDITEHKLLEETLKENEERFRTLAKICPIGIFRIDDAGLCLYVNEQWSRITGRPPEDAL